MKIFLNLIIFFVLTINSSFAENVDPVKNLLKTITGKSLNKEQTQKFLSEYVIIIEDERGDGLVTYLFDDRNYIRYKNYEQISTGAWRFTKTGQLRVFNQDVKLTWKIQIGKNNDNKINIKPKFDPLGKLYGFNYQAKEDFLSELSDYKEQLALEKKRLEQEKIDAKKKVEEEKAKLEQEKLEAQKKVEQEKAKAAEEKAKLEQEKLEAQQKAEEEKAKLEAEKAALEKEIAEQRKQLELEKLYIQLEPEFRRKCIKKALNDLYEVGTPEYKTCIINKGPEKQLKEAEENKIKLEQEKLEAQQKAKEKEEKLKQEKLVAQKKANELEKLKGSTDWNKLFDAIANRWMDATQPTPGMDETLTHLCLWKKINKSYLTGNHLVDDMYNMGPRVEVYDKLDPIFSQFDQTVGETINVDVSCDETLRRFSQ